jgi:hypothetical protein
MTLEEQFELMRARFREPSFLTNKGLGHEVGIHVFQYDPKQELHVRDLLRTLKQQSTHESFHLIEFDLYELFLEICKQQDIMQEVLRMESEEGSEELLKQLNNIADVKSFVKLMKSDSLVPGRDIVIITGVGRVYPIMRAHLVLNNIQHIFTQVPVVLFYPGSYDGQSLVLFSKIMDDNYYRAFNLL